MLHFFFFFFSKNLENTLRNSISKSELKKSHTYGRKSSEQRRSKRLDQYDPNMTPGPHLEFNYSLGFVPVRVHILRTYKWFVL